jgi:hypothetical protein
MRKPFAVYGIHSELLCFGWCLTEMVRPVFAFILLLTLHPIAMAETPQTPNIEAQHSPGELTGTA